jgi:hypothetical protein
VQFKVVFEAKKCLLCTGDGRDVLREVPAIEKCINATVALVYRAIEH